MGNALLALQYGSKKGKELEGDSEVLIATSDAMKRVANIWRESTNKRHLVTRAQHVALLHGRAALMGNRVAAVGWPRNSRRAGSTNAVVAAGTGGGEAAADA